MPIARIYRPAKTAMQSGRARAQSWVLAFEPASAKRPDRLIGWVGSRDMEADQVRMNFASKEAAIDFAEHHGIEYRIHEPHTRTVRPKAYADNFRSDRVGNWTH